MAKRSKKRRHRRVGALSLTKSDTGIKLIALAGGFFLGDTVNTIVDKMLPKDATTNQPTAGTQNLATIGQIGVGGLLLLRKKKSMVTSIAGGVIAGAGLKRAAKSMGFLAGYQAVPVIGRSAVRGYQNVPVVGKLPPQLNGRPAQLQGYRVNGYRPAGSGMYGGSGITGGTGVMQ